MRRCAVSLAALPPLGFSLSRTTPGGNCPDAKDFFETTNTYRLRHQAGPLAWSEPLAKDATAYAKVLADKGCPLVHGSYGENLMQVKRPPRTANWSTGVQIGQAGRIGVVCLGSGARGIRAREEGSEDERG